MHIVTDKPVTSINPAELREARPVVVAVYAVTGCPATAKRAAVQMGATRRQDWSQEADFAVRELQAMSGPHLLTEQPEPSHVRA